MLRAIRADAQLVPQPVVILTSSREPRDLVEGYKLGVNAYVVRPLKFQELIRAVKEIGLFWALINEPPLGTVRRTR